MNRSCGTPDGFDGLDDLEETAKKIKKLYEDGKKCKGIPLGRLPEDYYKPS
ncbi:MAG: hypothetical protein OXI27_10580 [Thaumarchaeota archaeon]|nr:hypothetical protein [Nitrososphaerota archaeon]